jgi:hypothetical protein
MGQVAGAGWIGGPEPSPYPRPLSVGCEVQVGQRGLDFRSTFPSDSTLTDALRVYSV